jgi:hypothetical protein
MTFPLGLEFGFPITSVFRANASFDLPFWITFSPSPVVGYIPILFGGGVEYLLQRDSGTDRTAEDGAHHRDQEHHPQRVLHPLFPLRHRLPLLSLGVVAEEELLRLGVHGLPWISCPRRTPVPPPAAWRWSRTTA